jgi:hypothetical protein
MSIETNRDMNTIKIELKTINEKKQKPCFSSFNRLVQNQIPGTYQHQVVEAWNELVTNIQNKNYYKIKHIIITGEHELGQTFFLRSLKRK